MTALVIAIGLIWIYFTAKYEHKKNLKAQAENLYITNKIEVLELKVKRLEQNQIEDCSDRSRRSP